MAVTVLIAAGEAVLLIVIWNLSFRHKHMASIMLAAASLIVLATVLIALKGSLPSYAPLVFAGTYVGTGCIWSVRRRRDLQG